MEKSVKIVCILFAIPWIVFGLQHFLYADFVATLVPAFLPFKLFWAYFTGTAMAAAGISFIINRFGKTAAILLGLMIWTFVFLIHVPALFINQFSVAGLTRPLQDVALACICTFLAQTFSGQQKDFLLDQLAHISKYIFAVILIGFGVQQIFNLDFLTAKVPLYFPFRIFWVNFMAAVMIVTAVCIITNRKTRLAAITLAFLLLTINVLNHGFLLTNNLHEPRLWTAAMLDLAITSGIFIFAVNVHRKLE